VALTLENKPIRVITTSTSPFMPLCQELSGNKVGIPRDGRGVSEKRERGKAIDKITRGHRHIFAMWPSNNSDQTQAKHLRR